MKSLRLLSAAFFVAAALFLSGARAVHASEGTAELRSTTGQAASCFAASVLMPDYNYQVVVSCRDLIYPATPEEFTYTLWTNPTTGGNAAKLGDLGVGKAQFKTKTAFSSLLVTRERGNRARTPSADIVMQGAVQSIRFLEGTPQPTAPTARTTPAQSFGEIVEQPEASPTIAPQTGGFFSGVRRAGVIVAVVLFVIILIIAAITRARG